MVLKAKLAFCLLNWQDFTSYQNKFTKPNFFIGVKPNIPNQTNWIKETKPNLTESTTSNLPNKIFQIVCFKYTWLDIPNQIYSIKATKLNPTNLFYQTKSREKNPQKIKVKSNPSLSWALPSSAPACFF